MFRLAAFRSNGVRGSITAAVSGVRGLACRAGQAYGVSIDARCGSTVMPMCFRASAGVRSAHDSAASSPAPFSATGEPIDPQLVSEEFERLAADLDGLDVSARADHVAQLVERESARYLAIEELRTLVVGSVAENFSWASLAELCEPSRRRLLARPYSQPLAAVKGVAKAACAALSAEGPNRPTSRDLENLIYILHFATGIDTAMIKQLNRAEALLAEAISGIDSVPPLLRLVIVLGDFRNKVTAMRPSPVLLLALYDRMAALLPETSVDMDTKWMKTVIVASICIGRLRVRHSEFLTAWESYVMRVVEVSGFQSVQHADSCMGCFNTLGHAAPTVQAAVYQLYSDPGNVPLGKGDWSTWEIQFLHGCLMCGEALPEAMCTRLIERLAKPGGLQPTAITAHKLEQLVFALPVPAPTKKLLAAVQAQGYYSSAIARHVQHLSKEQVGWQNVMLDVFCPGGRIPIVALLSKAEDRAILPWPEAVKPFMLTKLAASQMEGTPVAVVFPPASDLLHHPADVLVGTSKQKQQLLFAQGFQVYTIYSADKQRKALQCFTLAQLIDLAKLEAPLAIA